MSESGEKIKTVHIFLGFFFILNFCLGTGFLGIPYAFFYSGFLAAVPSLLLISTISWINANYLLEVMARAQVKGKRFDFCTSELLAVHIKVWVERAERLMLTQQKTETSH